MKRCLKKFFIILSILTLFVSNVAYAHSGRTDANGGHRDNKNKSGLGSYHYHCGGYPAHLHTNGVCPYSSTPSSSKSNNNSSSSSGSKNKEISGESSSNSKTVTPVTNTVNAENIKINENVKELNVGETKQLTTSILPTNTTDKKLVWKSSDENILAITESGQITAKGIGNVIISVSTNNGKTDSIEVLVKRAEEQKENQNIVVNTLENTNNVTNAVNTSENTNNVTNTVNNNSEDSNPIAGIVTLGVIGGGGYWIYKNRKKINRK